MNKNERFDSITGRFPPGSFMFYLQRYELFYMRIAKCASESISNWIKFNIDDIVSIRSNPVHIWENSFTCIRNPFDRLVSSYKHFIFRKQIPPIMQVEGLSYITFSEYVDRIITIGHPEELTDSEEVKRRFLYQNVNPTLDDWKYILRFHTVPMTHPFHDASKFTDILRFENLKNDWKNVLGKYGIPYLPLGHANKVEGEPYCTYYDEDIRNIVAEYFKEDLLTFDYQF